MIKRKPCLSLFDPGFSGFSQFFFFFFSFGRHRNVRICFVNEKIHRFGINSIRWPGLFTSKTVRKHRKFIPPYKEFIIRILSFVIFHPHISIRIFHPPSGPQFTETQETETEPGDFSADNRDNCSQ